MQSQQLQDILNAVSLLTTQQRNTLTYDDQAPELSGITELDEIFFRESFKGQKKGLPRPARKAR